jgi:hypothetical protein
MMVRSVARCANERNGWMEPLEARRLFTVFILNREVVIVGRNTADQVTIARNPIHTSQLLVSLNGSVATFASAAVDRFRINTKGGSDMVQVESTSGAIDQPRFVDLGDGNDTLISIAGRDIVQGQGGDDSIRSGSSADKVVGGDGNDTILGEEGGDFLSGGSGNDRLMGEGGIDHLDGGIGDDNLQGGPNNDILAGGDGSDELRGDSGNDFIDGNGGDDDVRGDAGDDLVFGDAGNDTVVGGTGNDALAGDAEDTLFGASNTNVFGNDSLQGSSGNDTLLASTGADTLVGGAGRDLFDVRTAQSNITDAGTQDRQTSMMFFNGLPAVQRNITLKIHSPDGSGIVSLSSNLLPVFTTGTPIVELFGSNTVRFSDAMDRAFTLGEFFDAAGISFGPRNIDRFAGPVTTTVNGIPTTLGRNLVINNGDVIDISPRT